MASVLVSGSSSVCRVGASVDRAHGAFLGLLCGDAAGATLEFARGVITEPHVSHAMTMPGGGVFGVGKGQITDDSELALSLAHGLLGHRPSDGFPLESVARRYAAWCDSKPFDIGRTCATAFGVEPDAGGNYAAVMTQTAAASCCGSEANGSLMRIAPLAIWGVGESEDTIAALARTEATLSHPSQVCQDCNAVYCLMLEHLLRCPGDFRGALSCGEQFVTTDVNSVNETYERAIHQTLMKGGDTDTNAAIVGGLIGALHGVEAIPVRMREAVLTFDASKPSATRRPRPEAYRGAQVTRLVEQLLGRED
ncbi:ADP-ribosylglycohydrolase family protein [Phytophthora cinnamomi]|uniref:ADP-ribosylglycohydrolase family protein n=1 Tax=Phytophthora cinnamomi TaxID=4785 RepID=UPI003559BEB4|nr:ADP-ribosylglycohydrolase family protein [Phytophthora cinnamomi]